MPSLPTTTQEYIDAKLTHSIHTSGAKSFRSCRRRWDWLMRQYWYPKVTAKPLEFGVAFHKAAEVLYDPDLWKKNSHVVESVAIVEFNKSCKAQRAKYEEEFGRDPEVDKDFAERIELGRGMISYWVANGRAQDIEKGYTPLKVEIPFEVPLMSSTTTPLYCKCTSCWNRWIHANGALGLSIYPSAYDGWLGLPVTYGGRVDCLMEGPDGRIWIVDWKSCTTLSEDEEFLLIDDQVRRYAAAFWKMGYYVAGFLYHEQRKAFPQEPEPLTRRYMGKLYSTNKQQAVELKTYYNTIKENDPVAFQEGLYEEYLEYLAANPNQFSNRHVIYLGDDDLESCWNDLFQEALDQIDPNIRIYPNPGRFHCKTCAFKVPCLEMNRNGDVVFALESLFEKRRYHYYEDKVPSTETKGNE